MSIYSVVRKLAYSCKALFQRLMQKVVAGLGGEEPFCNVYIDDVYSVTDRFVTFGGPAASV